MQVSRDAILQGIGIFLPHGSDISGDVQISCKLYLFTYLLSIIMCVFGYPSSGRSSCRSSGFTICVIILKVEFMTINTLF